MRQILGIIFIALAVDLAATMTLGHNASSTFSTVGDAPAVTPASNDSWLGYLPSAILAGLGVGIFFWGGRPDKRLAPPANES